MRGGTHVKTIKTTSELGLSPLARGNLLRGQTRVRQDGSIPACAGEPTRCGGHRSDERVYPRLRGGTPITSAGVTSVGGLSPLARGNHPAALTPAAARGSIPACAGEPVWSYEIKRGTKVYPRLRGGTNIEAKAARESPGLSPLARGNPDHLGGRDQRRGSIPACAGEPFLAAGLSCATGVYPRLRGGTASRAESTITGWGLSPLARGNLLDVLARVGGWWSIPACAGEPGSGLLKSPPSRVYPRLRGGTDSGLLGLFGSGGLSPLARGNLAHHHALHIPEGSIPACAGEPRREARSSRSLSSMRIMVGLLA